MIFMQIGAVNQVQGNEQTQNNGSHVNKQDPRIKSIQSQIENVRKRLNELSANDNMSVEQKIERRKQLNEQMKELTERLSQVQMEIQQENMRKAEKGKSEQSNDSKNQSNNSGVKNVGLSENIISADLSLKQMQEFESFKAGMEGYKNILKNQIKQDIKRGVNTENKEKELSEIENGIRNTEKNINEKMGEVNKKASQTEDEDNNNEDEKDKNIYYSVDIKL